MVTIATLHRAKSSLGTTVITACALVGGLGSGSCNSYFNPYRDIVLHVADADAELEVRAEIDQFAQHRHLVMAPAATGSPAPESVQRAKAKTTYYISGKRYGEGRAVTYFDASLSCKVVRLVEGGRAWNTQAQTDLVELRTKLDAIEGVEVEQGANFDEGAKNGRAITEYCSSSME
jgi:hypothetical protein